MRTRKQIHPFLNPGLRKRLALYASQEGATQSAVVESALIRYLDEEVTDRDLILRRLDRIDTNAGQADPELGALVARIRGIRPTLVRPCSSAPGRCQGGRRAIRFSALRAIH